MEAQLILLEGSTLRYDSHGVLLHHHMFFSLFSCHICGLLGWVWDVGRYGFVYVDSWIAYELVTT